MSLYSDSDTQRSAEKLILDAVALKVGVPLSPRRLELGSGPVVDVDGVAEDESVLVEIFAHQGHLKGGQRHKIAGDALKLSTIAKVWPKRPRLILAFGDPDILKFFDGRSWLASAINTWGIEILVAEFDVAARDSIRVAQARQVMVNPSE
jgi:hypothetical protein